MAQHQAMPAEMYSPTSILPPPTVLPPAALESEVFDHDGHVRVQQRQNRQVEDSGCWYMFTSAIRSIWQTKYTEDSRDREMLIKTQLRELVVYLVFLTTLCIISFGMTSSSTFYLTNTINGVFISQTTPAFTDIGNMDDFWNYLYGSGTTDFLQLGLLSNIYDEEWYDGTVKTGDDANSVFFENKLLGVPRLRQLKVTNTSCTVPPAFEREIVECFDSYTQRNEDQSPYGPLVSQGTTGCLVDNATGAPICTAWMYTGMCHLSVFVVHMCTDGTTMGAIGFTGQVSTYGTGGFYQLLATTRDESTAIVDHLMANRWITRGTRVVFIDFTVYNANLNLFCVVKLIVEFPATGGSLPMYSLSTIKLLRYVSNFDYFILACEALYVMFTIYYFIEETIELVKWRCSYFNDFWNCLDVIIWLLSVTCIGMSVYRTLRVNSQLDELLHSPNDYANFEFLAWTQYTFNVTVAIMLFCSWIKIFKYISFNNTMNQLAMTLSRSAKDVGGFAIMFFIFFFAYAQLGYLLFGTQIGAFSTFYMASFTLLRTILGDFDFHSLEQANRVLGPIFFISYVFFVFFVLLNMFLAIINDTYATVKEELRTQKSEFELGDLFRKSYYNMMRKLNLKKDRISDIKNVLTAGGKDGQPITHDEWIKQMTHRGFEREEIESMFINHDINHDGELNKIEAQQWVNELDGITDADVGANGNGRMAGGDIGSTVPIDDFHIMARRVDRVEQSVTTSIVKIDAAIYKLENVDRIKNTHRHRMTAITAEIDSQNTSDGEKHMKLIEAIQMEMNRLEHDNGAE